MFDVFVRAASFSLAFDASDSAPGRIKSAVSGQGPRGAVPGAEFVSKAASKNAKKRAAKKKAGGADSDGESQPQQRPAGGGAAAAAAKAAAGAVQQLSVSGSGKPAADDGPEAAEKRVRALQKKLRQIRQLRDKCEKEGAALEPEQLHKLAAEEAVLSEIKSLGGSV